MIMYLVKKLGFSELTVTTIVKHFLLLPFEGSVLLVKWVIHSLRSPTMIKETFELGIIQELKLLLETVGLKATISF